MALQSGGAGSTCAALMLFLIFMGVALVLPVTLNSELRNATQPPAPMGNEFAIPAGALALGDADNFTQRVCPSSSLMLPMRATNERLLSNQLFVQGVDIPDPRNLNALVWGMGQFIDHDVILSTANDALAGDTIEMLPNTGTFLELSRVERRLSAQNLIETRNLLSGALDLTTVYGDYKDASRLPVMRENINGTLQCVMREGPNRTPHVVDGQFYCGDVRCNEHILLSSLHALWLREHNRVCVELSARYPWTQEQLFWQARAQTIAVYQHIIYTEWLPTLFGSLSYLYGSDGQAVAQRGTYTRVSTEFGAAAFRFGHTMVAERLGELVVRDLFMKPNLTMELGPDAILLRGLRTHAERVDRRVVDSLRNFLFTSQHFTVSEDLVTRNLYRSREIRMASYEDLCRCFGTSPTATLQEGVATDPLLGLLSEPLVEGSSLPPTLARVLAEQFRRLRDNDEGFYTRVPQLTPDDLYRIKRTSMRDVLVRNTQLSEGDIPADPFRL